MTEKTDDQEKEEKEYTEDEIAVLSEASFNAGFDDVMGDKPEEETLETGPETSPDKHDEEAAEEPIKEPIKEPAPDALAKLTEQFEKLQGRVGSVRQQIDEGIKAGVQKAISEQAARIPGPTDAQVKIAIDNEEAMNALIEDYPAFAPMAEQLKAVREAFTEQNASIDSKIDTKFAESQQRLQAEHQQGVQAQQHDAQQQAMAEAHSDWMEVIQSDDFHAFALDNGPSVEDYRAVSALMNQSGTSQEADRTVFAWARQYPQWWSATGANLFSSGSAGSITLLDQYRDKDKPNDLEAERIKRRTASTTTVIGKPQGRTTDKNVEHDAFLSGFDKVFRKL